MTYVSMIIFVALTYVGLKAHFRIRIKSTSELY